jgi:hypothetical protein
MLSQLPPRPDPGALPSSAFPEQVGYTMNFLAGATRTQKVVISFDQQSTPVFGAAATATYPLIAVSGAGPGLRHRLAETVNCRIGVLMDRYRNQLVSRHQTGAPLTQTITVRSDAQWGHTVSIVFTDEESFADRAPRIAITAVVIDTRTGRSIAPADLFTDINAVDGLMRKAIRAKSPPNDATVARVASLTMRPGKDGTSSPLTWYPTADGLRWIVDRGAITSKVKGELAVTVAWPTLAEAMNESAEVAASGIPGS